MWEHLTLYPDVPSERRGQIVRDLLVVALIALFVWIGVSVYHLVDALSVLGEGGTGAGDGIQGAFDSVGDAVSNVPIVGDALGGAFHGAGDATGGNLSDRGQQGQQPDQEGTARDPGHRDSIGSMVNSERSPSACRYSMLRTRPRPPLTVMRWTSAAIFCSLGSRVSVHLSELPARCKR